jgi:hypothetical protein
MSAVGFVRRNLFRLKTVLPFPTPVSFKRQFADNKQVCVGDGPIKCRGKYRAANQYSRNPCPSANGTNARTRAHDAISRPALKQLLALQSLSIF